MRALLVVSIASVVLATTAFAQPPHRTSKVRPQAALAPTEISKLCGVSYAITDPDPNIRLELIRSCTMTGLEGGAD